MLINKQHHDEPELVAVAVERITVPAYTSGQRPSSDSDALTTTLDWRQRIRIRAGLCCVSSDSRNCAIAPTESPRLSFQVHIRRMKRYLIYMTFLSCPNARNHSNTAPTHNHTTNQETTCNDGDVELGHRRPLVVCPRL
jgi:hypothetical protein